MIKLNKKDLFVVKKECAQKNKNLKHLFCVSKLIVFLYVILICQVSFAQEDIKKHNEIVQKIENLDKSNLKEFWLVNKYREENLDEERQYGVKFNLKRNAISSMKKCLTVYRKYSEEELKYLGLDNNLIKEQNITDWSNYCDILLKNKIELQCISNIFYNNKQNIISSDKKNPLTYWQMQKELPEDYSKEFAENEVKFFPFLSTFGLSSINACYINTEMRKKDLGRIIVKSDYMLINKNVEFKESVLETEGKQINTIIAKIEVLPPNQPSVFINVETVDNKKEFEKNATSTEKLIKFIKQAFIKLIKFLLTGLFKQIETPN